MVRQIILAGFAVFLPVGMQGQGRGAMPSVSHAAAVAPRVAMPAPHAAPWQIVGVPRMVARGGMVRPRTAMPMVRITRRPATTQRRVDRFDREDFGRRPGCNSAPGLGFDAVHQAAVCGSGIVGSRGRGQIPAFFPFFDGGFFLPGSQAAVEEISAGDAAAAEESEIEARIEAREAIRRRRASEPVTAQTPPVEAAGATSSDSDGFVFVRRDGTIFFAVAYSWENGTLRYVTSQGLRHTVTQDALDLDATRQFNEQRGLNFRLPA